MSKGLYRVTWVDQDNGREVESYVLANDIRTLIDEFADIMRIDILDVEDLDE